ncbi:hypothetical protein V1525DRAFT_268748 [Lipomyces kononenkoae]|uniref:Uncharacterized protein n=1 Tax=Lipomyces kononenkoae TaxID=34357 RepID=A0ACC3SVZ3_LIPKO
MSASSPQTARRVLGDVSANIMHASHSTVNKPVDLYPAAVGCSPIDRKTGLARGSESKIPPVSNSTEVHDESSQCNILPSSPQQPSTQDVATRHASTTDEIQKTQAAPQSPSRELSSPASVRRSNCKVHADRLRMRLRLAMYKVRINQTATPLGDLPLPQFALLSGSSAFASSISPLMSSYQPSLTSNAFTGTGTIEGLRTASVSNAEANTSSSIAAMRLQSLPAAMSDGAIRTATDVSNRPQLPRRKNMASFIRSSRTRHSATGKSAKSANRAVSHSFDMATNIGRWRGHSKKHHSGSKRASFSGTIVKDTSTKRARHVTLPDTCAPWKDNSVTVVTPARKRSSLPDKMVVVPRLGTDNEGSSGPFSSPFKSQLPSSAIKGTPGQIGAAKSLLELGCL